MTRWSWVGSSSRAFPYRSSPDLRPGPREVLIELLDDGPDEMGRSYFSICWLENSYWRGGDGMAGQVQHTSVDEAISRWHRSHPDWSFCIVQSRNRA